MLKSYKRKYSEILQEIKDKSQVYSQHMEKLMRSCKTREQIEGLICYHHQIVDILWNMGKKFKPRYVDKDKYMNQVLQYIGDYTFYISNLYTTLLNKK